MMKKMILTLCCCSLFPLQLQAQLLSRGMRQVKKIFVPQAVRRNPSATGAASVLNKRALNSVALSNQVRQELLQSGVHVPGFVPVQSACITREDLPHLQKIYPSKYLTKGQTETVCKNHENYLTAEHNRRYASYASSIEQRAPRVPQIMEQINQTTLVPSHTQDSAQWLAQQTPSNTRVLAIGQGFYHNPAVIEATSRFLKELRQQIPQRKIILLSSFLEEGVTWTPQLNEEIRQSSNYRKGYELLWQNAYNDNIQVVGMERPEIFRGFTGSFEGVDNEGVPAWSDWQRSLEAVSLESQLITKKVEIYQKAYPDALIVLYVDKEHASFNFPFSAVNKLEQDNLHVVQIVSKTNPRVTNLIFPGEEDMPLSTRTTLFEQMYQQAHLPEAGVVSRGLAKDVGSDGWIKVEYDPSKHDDGQY